VGLAKETCRLLLRFDGDNISGLPLHTSKIQNPRAKILLKNIELLPRLLLCLTDLVTETAILESLTAFLMNLSDVAFVNFRDKIEQQT